MKVCFFTLLILVTATVVARTMGIVTDIHLLDQAILALIQSARLW